MKQTINFTAICSNIIILIHNKETLVNSEFDALNV